MAKYHLYFLKDRCVVAAEDIEAPDNLAAIRVARHNPAGRVVEVWNAHSLLQTVAPEQDELMPSGAPAYSMS
jgi:hypothetical protein